MKYAVYRANDPQLENVHLKLGQPRAFLCAGRTVMMIPLVDANTGEIVVLQPKKIFHRGPVRNTESDDLLFQFQSGFDADFSFVINRLHSEVENQVIDFLSHENSPKEIPIDYRLLAREAKQSKERLKVLYDGPADKNFTARCEEYTLAEKRSHILKPSFKEGKMWLKSVYNFHVFDTKNQIIENAGKQLGLGDYDFGVRVGDVYIGPHGDSSYIGSLQCRIVQIRYNSRPDIDSVEMDLSTCVLLSSPSAAAYQDGEILMERKKARHSDNSDVSQRPRGV